jgi:anti-sigma regulatory factor (Ser/Thr protein kinase)
VRQPPSNPSTVDLERRRASRTPFPRHEVHAWYARLAREAERQARIESAFEAADDCGRLGEYERALEWLDEAEGLSGGEAPAYREARARWERAGGQVEREHTGGGAMNEPAAEASGAGRSAAATAFAFELEGGPGAGKAARRALLALDGTLPEPTRGDLLLLVSELVTNAVRHGEVGPGRSLRIEGVRSGPRVTIEVTDPGSGFDMVLPARSEPGGWGLVLVDRLAERWGVNRTPTGTCVWFEMRFEG